MVTSRFPGRTQMPLDPSRLMALAPAPRDIVYSRRDSLLYALSVGFGADGDPGDLSFVYESARHVPPTMATMLGFDDRWLPQGGIALADAVHAALDLRFHATLASEGVADAATRIVGLDDKGAGRGGLVFEETAIRQGGRDACTILSTLFVRGGGGFGGSVGRRPTLPAVPDTPPAEGCRLATAPNQALLFRLLGDRNPLHWDLEAARRAGFDRPILHGACTFGIACAALLRRDGHRGPDRLRRLAARFAGPVYPGETLVFSFWPDGERVAFRAATGRGALVLDNGMAEFGEPGRC